MAKASTPPPVVLASGSPYRAELLGRLGLDFEVVVSEVDETPRQGESALDLARRLAAAKARAVAADRPQSLVIGSDQTAVCRERLLGKPGDRDRAIEQLGWCSGSDVVFHTAVAVRHGERELGDSESTTVTLRVLERDAIERYVDRDRPFNCAGAMKSESLGIALARRMRSDDPTALIGLPLIRLAGLLERFGIVVP
jgi:septum formation protein